MPPVKFSDPRRSMSQEFVFCQNRWCLSRKPLSTTHIRVRVYIWLRLCVLWLGGYQFETRAREAHWRRWSPSLSFYTDHRFHRPVPVLNTFDGIVTRVTRAHLIPYLCCYEYGAEGIAGVTWPVSWAPCSPSHHNRHRANTGMYRYQGCSALINPTVSTQREFESF